MTEKLSLLEADGLLEVRFNRPEKHNAISDEMWDGLREAVARFASRPEELQSC